MNNAQGVGTSPVAPVDASMVALMRCLLALSALLILGFDPAGPFGYDTGIYAGLVAYCLYSVALCIAVIARRTPIPPRAQHWIDVLAFAGLVGLTEGTYNIFFHFFFFAILVASFSRGFREGFAVTLASVALFATVCFAMAPASAFAAEFEDLMIRPVYLLVIGYMMAYWGGHEITSRRRLQLLNDIAGLANPRLGVDHAVAQSLRRLLEFFGARACVLVCERGQPARYLMYRVSAHNGRRTREPLVLTEDSARELLALPAELSVSWPSSRLQRDAVAGDACGRLANLLESQSFVTVPYRPREGAPGRLYLVNPLRPLAPSDIAFLGQSAGQIAASIEHLVLLDEVMANAAQLERARISRDIHDTTIQPYIGLKLGLEALQRKVDPGSAVSERVRELIAASNAVIEDLRGYVARLRGGGTGWPGEHLLSGLRDHVGRYRNFYGIDVQLRADAAVQVTDRVATEAYQIVCEGLSNIYKHTKAKSAFVELRCDGGSLAIEVGNECGYQSRRERFMPRSISERASALGGKTEVRLGYAGHDVVRVAIPL